MTDPTGQAAEVRKRYPVKLNAYCKALAERSSAVAKLYLPDVRELENPGLSSDGLAAVSYTHLTLPTKAFV